MVIFRGLREACCALTAARVLLDHHSRPGEGAPQAALLKNQTPENGCSFHIS